MSLIKKSIKIVIDKNGNYTLIAGEGMEGASCVEKTRDIELVLGGHEIDSGKTDAYYKGDDSPISINLDL